MHAWLQQVSLHAGFYRFWAGMTDKASNNGQARVEDSMTNLLADAPRPKQDLQKTLSTDDAMKVAIMSSTKWTPGEARDTGAMRGWILRRFIKENVLAEKVKQVTRELAGIGLLQQAEAENIGPGRKNG